MKQKIVKLISLAFIATVVSSCGYASKSDLDKLRAEMGELRINTQQAMSTADDAKRTADQSLEMSRRTEEIVNRSFKQSMRK